MNIDFNKHPAIIRFTHVGTSWDYGFECKFDLTLMECSTTRLDRYSSTSTVIRCDITEEQLNQILPYITWQNIIKFSRLSSKELAKLENGYRDGWHQECQCYNQEYEIICSMNLSYYYIGNPLEILLAWMEETYPSLNI